MRVLQLGPGRMATQEHIRTVFTLFSYETLGLSYAHIFRVDAMDKEGAARTCALQVQRCLARTAEGFTDNGGVVHPPQTSMLGTLEYLRMMSRYLIVFFGCKASLKERVEHAAFVVGFLRRSRGYVKHNCMLTIKDHFLPRQTYQHVRLRWWVVKSTKTFSDLHEIALTTYFRARISTTLVTHLLIRPRRSVAGLGTHVLA